MSTEKHGTVHLQPRTCSEKRFKDFKKYIYINQQRINTKPGLLTDVEWSENY